ncbi:MAG: hypothetical protein KAU90_01730, partial [Sulfurovaceae bacterium]|nr:hypothetical protein [Sulfurovaceae bacterium]
SFDNFGAGGRTSSPYTTYCYEDGDGYSTCQNKKGIKYWPGSTNVNDGEYAIVQHPKPDASGFSTWSKQGDHTGNPNGRMMVINASLQPDEFFRKTYTIVPHANMTIDLWILNVVKHRSNIIRPNISFKLEDMNGNQVGDIVTTGDIPENEKWNHYILSINPQENRQIQVVLSNNAPGGGGNDLALDDIRVTQTFCDHDKDGIADYLDLDSDNDGIPDNIEAQTTQDYIPPSGVEDENGADTAYNGVSLTPVDTDGDGVPDFIDSDSDNDSTPDIDESGLPNHSGSVGENGLDNNLEFSDDYNYTQGIAYNKITHIFILDDSDNDTLYNGSNASPMGIDFDYRDNNDSKPIFSISNISKKEGDSGVSNFKFKVSINRTTGHGISFDYQTDNGNSSNSLQNAISGSDYNSVNGHIDIAEDIISKTITVPVIGDTDIEDDEKFLLKALNINGADTNSFVATGTIINDDDTHINNNLSTTDLDSDNDGIFNDIEIGSGDNLITNSDGNFTKIITTKKDELYRFSCILNTNSSSSVNGELKAYENNNSSIIINNKFNTTNRYDAFFKAKSNRTRISIKTNSQDVNLSILKVDDDDNDTIPNFLDLDSDNDGIPDNIEAQTTQDYIPPSGIEDENGADTAYNGVSLTPVDTDGDGVPDYIDNDSDNDDTPDIDESGLPNHSGSIGENGLDNNLELSDDYNNTQGKAYNKNDSKFNLADSDDDTKNSGINASPTQTDFDYRDTVDNTPHVSIDEMISKSEGDSGTKIFRFKIHLTEIPADLDESSTMSYIVRSPLQNELSTPTHYIATECEDFIGKEETITIQEGVYDYYIDVEVKGDKKIENDEEFLVDITDIKFVNKVINSKGTGVILNDDLDIKVERDNSKFKKPKDSSFYTQISGHDFNYSIASYKEGDNSNPLNNMTFKVKLYNNDINSVEMVDYVYFSEDESRVVIDKNSDLNISKAIKDAHFQIFYLKDENGTILHGDYATEQQYQDKLNSNKNREVFPNKENKASDDFSIRPEKIIITIKDLDENNKTVVYHTPLNLVAGYPYIIEANASLYNSNQLTQSYTTSDINSTLIFNTNGSCNDEDNKTFNYSFSDGSFESNISNSNVGNYLLDINDSEWTKIDQDNNNLGCILNSSSNTPDSDGKVGCNIGVVSKLELDFRPYSFDITNTILKNANGSNKDYLYMSDLTLSTTMAVAIDTDIIAKGFYEETLTNFSKNCVAQNVLLSLDYNTSFKNIDGSSEIKSIKKHNLKPQQIINFNDETDTNVLDFNKTISIPSYKFLDDNNGTTTIKILYNIEKKFTEATNPIKVNFISFDTNSTSSKAKIRGKDRIPTKVINSGNIDRSKTFYFARVSPDRISYPETARKNIVTPLNVEIYCKVEGNRTWCDNDMNMTNIGYNGINTDRGWYLDKEHDNIRDGKVYGLTSNNPLFITTQPSTIPPFIHGRIDNIKAIYNSNKPLHGKVSAKINIDTDVWLRYSTKNQQGIPSYKVTFRKSSSFTGTGKTGFMTNWAQHRENALQRNEKMSW